MDGTINLNHVADKTDFLFITEDGRLAHCQGNIFGNYIITFLT